jgi:hypothetical protein
MVTTVDFPQDFCIQRNTLRKASQTRDEELLQFLLIFLELLGCGNLPETFLTTVKGIVSLLGQVFVDNPVGRPLENILGQDGEELVFGKTFWAESKK